MTPIKVLDLIKSCLESRPIDLHRNGPHDEFRGKVKVVEVSGKRLTIKTEGTTYRKISSVESKRSRRNTFSATLNDATVEFRSDGTVCLTGWSCFDKVFIRSH